MQSQCQCQKFTMFVQFVKFNFLSSLLWNILFKEYLRHVNIVMNTVKSNTAWWKCLQYMLSKFSQRRFSFNWHIWISMIRLYQVSWLMWNEPTICDLALLPGDCLPGLAFLVSLSGIFLWDPTGGEQLFISILLLNNVILGHIYYMYM